MGFSHIHTKMTKEINIIHTHILFTVYPFSLSSLQHNQKRKHHIIHSTGALKIIVLRPEINLKIESKTNAKKK